MRGCRTLLLALLCAIPWTGSLRAAEDAVIEGTLEDLSGEPLAAVEVELVPADYHGRKEITTADERGRFRIDPVKPGPYKLRFRGKEIYSLEAAASAQGAASAWEVAGIFDPESLPVLPVGDGQLMRLIAVLVDPGQAVERDPASFRSRLDEATELVRQGRCADAIGKLQRHLEAFPGSARASYLLGYCQASGGDAEQGIRSLERAAELDPAMPGVALLIGQILMQLQRPEDAARWFRQEAGIAGNPTLAANAWIALGFIERDQGNSAEAIEAFESARELAPERPEPYRELALLYADAGNRDKLEQVLQAAAEVGPVDIEPLLNLGISQLNEGRFEEADSIFRRALELASDDAGRAMAWALTGRSQLRQERRKEGIESLRKSLALDADGRFAQECRNILEQIGA